ncbi:hypothetical protein L2E82_24747 [Cichorium intybus]|uniref:Uncharacterized protein n=1 Tax=Cichorium intybus TaxID=13427 RepID=A0ACB9E2P9_CICIN|nr:hypothetical protein L2E82_24747 [Cichorium intybus]
MVEAVGLEKAGGDIRRVECVLFIALAFNFRIYHMFIIYVIGIGKIAVHGAWVSGKRIQPGVPVKLKKGDTVKMGGSSRIYELYWVPLSQAFDVDDPFMPATFIKQQETQDENSSYLEILQTNSSNDENSTKEKPFSVLKCSKSCCGDTETEHSTKFPLFLFKDKYMLTQFETLKCTYALCRELSVMGYHLRFVYWKEMSMRVQEGRTFYYIFIIFTSKSK